MTKEFSKGDKSEGTGLGLSIVKKVVKAMDAKIELAKNPTQFIIYIKRGNS